MPTEKPPRSSAAGAPSSRERTGELPASFPGGAIQPTQPTRVSTSLLGETPEIVPESDHVVIIRAADATRIGTRVLFQGNEVKVGRKPDSGLVLAFDEHVSGRHARFVRDAGGWAVLDEGSRNGTFLNGARVSGPPVRLSNGDNVRIGTTTFAFVSRAAAAGRADDEDDLPFPVAVSARIVAHQTTPFARVKALLDGIETTLRLAFAAELAAVRDLMDAQAHDALAHELANVGNVTKGAALSMGDWVVLATRAARIAQAGPDAGVAAMARALGEKAFAERLREAVAFRNKHVGHGKLLHENAFRADEQPLADTFRALVGATRPMPPLVTVAEMEFRRAKVAYTLYALRGPNELFPTFRHETAAMLEKGWAYLLRDGAAALSLAPVVFTGVSESTRKLEVFLAEGLVLGPEGAEVRGRGVTSNVAHAVELQWSDAAAALHARFLARAGERRGR